MSLGLNESIAPRNSMLLSGIGFQKLPMMTSSNGNIFHITGPLRRGIHQSPVNSPHKGQWCRALMFSLICDWIYSWVSNREAGDLRNHCTHYDVTVMMRFFAGWIPQSENWFIMKFSPINSLHIMLLSTVWFHDDAKKIWNLLFLWWWIPPGLFCFSHVHWTRIC